MTDSFAGSDLINIAIGIERNQIAFYDIMSMSTENAETSDIFRHLAQMERQHIQIFQGMLDESNTYPEIENEEYMSYLQTLADNAVFTDELVTSELATQADSDIKALELAIAAEKDSLLFYYQMRDMIPRQAYPAVSKIIDEEKSHLSQLSELKKRLTAS